MTPPSGLILQNKSFRNFFFSVSSDHSCFFISSPTQNAIQKNYFSHLGPHPSFWWANGGSMMVFTVSSIPEKTGQLLSYTFSSNLSKWPPRLNKPEESSYASQCLHCPTLWDLMLGRIEPMSEYNTQAKTQVPKCISSVVSIGPPDPTTIGAGFYTPWPYTELQTPTYRSSAHISIQTSIQHISPGNAPRTLILPLKSAEGAQF
jgi:hypothetical protein